MSMVMFSDEHLKRHLHHEAAVFLTASSAHKLQLLIQNQAAQHFPEAVKNNWVDLHATTMWNLQRERKGWKTDWSRYSRSAMESYFEIVAAAIGELASNIIIQPLRKRQEGGPFYSGETRSWALAFLMQRFDQECGRLGQVGQVYFDHGSDLTLDREIQVFLHNWVTNENDAPFSPKVERVVLPPVPTSSTLSAGIQAADFVAYIYGRRLESNRNPKWDDAETSKYWALLGNVEVRNPWPSR